MQIKHNFNTLKAEEKTELGMNSGRVDDKGKSWEEWETHCF
jgi:hypothetical protein